MDDLFQAFAYPTWTSGKSQQSGSLVLAKQDGPKRKENKTTTYWNHTDQLSKQEKFNSFNVTGWY